MINRIQHIFEGLINVTGFRKYSFLFGITGNHRRDHSNEINISVNRYMLFYQSHMSHNTQNKRRVVVALVSVISAYGSPLVRVVLHWSH